MKTYVIKKTATVYQLSGPVLRKNDQNKLIGLVAGDIIMVDESLFIEEGDSVLLVFSNGSMLPLDQSSKGLCPSLCVLQDENKPNVQHIENTDEEIYSVPTFSEYKLWHEEQDSSIQIDPTVLSNTFDHIPDELDQESTDKYIDINKLIAKSDIQYNTDEQFIVTNEHQLSDLLDSYFADAELIPPIEPPDKS